jgi:hypothetical protein
MDAATLKRRIASLEANWRRRPTFSKTVNPEWLEVWKAHVEKLFRKRQFEAVRRELELAPFLFT